MAEWRLDNVSSARSNSEILQSWNNLDSSPAAAAHTANAKPEVWHGRQIPGLSRDDLSSLQKLEISGVERHRYDPNEQKSTSITPLGRVNSMLDDHSPSSQWLKDRGYLESFKSDKCTLELSFGADKGGGKVGAVLLAPDGTKRTVVACENGTSFQRLTGPNGQELVKFTSSGQVIELNPYRRVGA